jgi:hypothetical protein
MMVMRHELNVARQNLIQCVFIRHLTPMLSSGPSICLSEAVADDDTFRMQLTLDNPRHIALALTLMTSHS